MLPSAAGKPFPGSADRTASVPHKVIYRARKVVLTKKIEI